MIDRLEQMEQRYEDLSAQLGLPEVIHDHEKYQKAGRALRELQAPVEKFRALKQVRQGLAEARAMLSESDPELRAMAEEEIASLAPREPALEEEIKLLLLPKDPNDEKNVILEIRAGTGGDEASLFAAEIFRMYTRFAEQHRWKVEVLSLSESGVGGYKEVIAIIEGERVYSQLKWESGMPACLSAAHADASPSFYALGTAPPWLYQAPAPCSIVSSLTSHHGSRLRPKHQTGPPCVYALKSLKPGALTKHVMTTPSKSSLRAVRRIPPFKACPAGSPFVRRLSPRQAPHALHEPPPARRPK